MEANISPAVSLKELQRVWSITRKNWWILVLFVAFFWGIGNFYAYKQTNVFSAQTQILLKSNDQYNQGSVISDVQTGYYGGMSKTFIDNSNEKRVISSYDLIRETIERLDFNVSYYLVGRIKTIEVFQRLPFHVKVVVVNAEMYEKLINLKVLDDKHYKLTYLKGDKEVVVNGTFGEDLVNTDMHVVVEKKLFITGGDTKILQKADYQIQIHNTATLVSRYKSSMVVDNPNYTNILQVSVEDVIPERAVMFLDTLIAVYNENTLESRIEINKNTLFFIDKEKQAITNILNDIEDTLQHFREKNAIISLSLEGEQYFKQYIELNNNKRSLQLAVKSLDNLEQYIIENKDSLFLPPAAFLSFGDPYLNKSATSLYEMQMQYNNLLNTVTPNHMGVSLLRQNIDSLRSNMLNYIREDRAALISLIGGVSLQKDSSVMDIQKIPLQERGLVNIERKRRVNEDLYMFLLKQEASTVLARAGIVPMTKIVEAPRNMGVLRPDRQKIIFLFAGIGAVIALVIILIRVFMFDRIESYEELKSATALPIVGEIVRSKELEELKVVVEHDPKSVIAESFRTIRTNLQYMLGDRQNGIIVITSNSPGEGKTFCSINLASILAKADKKVLLMELDLHKPRVQRGIGIDSNIGISTYVIGKSRMDEIILPTQIENLSVVLSGPLPPNPSEIVVSHKMTDLLDYCRPLFDYIIIDTPPVGLITDALVLMKSAEVTLFVMNTRVSYRRSLNNAHEIVAMNKLKHFGFILNGVKQRRSKYYYNRYGYGYTYGAYGSKGYGSYGSYGSQGSKSGRK